MWAWIPLLCAFKWWTNRWQACYKTGALGAVFPPCFKLSVGTTWAECQNKLPDANMKAAVECFSGDILKLDQAHHCGAGCREGLQMTWQVPWDSSVCNMCGSLSSSCSISEFCCWSICLWEVLAYVYAHIQGKNSITYITSVLTEENWHQKRPCGQMQ